VTVGHYSVNPVAHYGVQNGLRWHPPQGARGNKGNLTIMTLSRGWNRPYAGLYPLSDDDSMKNREAYSANGLFSHLLYGLVKTFGMCVERLVTYSPS